MTMTMMIWEWVYQSHVSAAHTHRFLDIGAPDAMVTLETLEYAPFGGHESLFLVSLVVGDAVVDQLFQCALVALEWLLGDDVSEAEGAVVDLRRVRFHRKMTLEEVVAFEVDR